MDLRFQADHVADSLPFVALAVADLAHCVHEPHPRHPLVYRELDFPGEVVDVSDQ